MSILDQQAAIPHYYDDYHPDDSANWPQRRQYVTSTQTRHGANPARTSHVVVARLEYLPDGWLAACRRVIRGTVSATPPLQLCTNCQRGVGEL